MPTEMEQRKGMTYIIPPDYEESEFEISEDEKAFQAFADEAKDNEQYSKLTVSRVPMNRHGQRGAQKLSFLFEAAIDEYSYSQLLGKLRDEYGSGFYKIQARNEKGQLKLNKTVAVEAPVNETDKSVADNPTTLIIEQFSRSLTEQQSEMRELMTQNKPASGPDVIDQIVKIAAAIAPILTALGISRPEPVAPPKTVIEMLTEAKMVNELMGGGNETQYGEANGWSALTETLKALGPAIGGALAAGPTGGGPVASVPDAAVAQLEAPPVAINEVEKMTPEKIETEKAALTKQINMLLIQAKGGANPLAVANVIVDMTPPENEERLWDTISDEKCIDKMIAAVPEVENHREWFESLRDFIIEIMAEPLVAEPEDAAHVIETKEMMENLQNSENVDNLSDNSEAVAGTVTSHTDSLTDASDERDTTGNPGG